MTIPFNNGCDPTVTVANHATQLPHGYDLGGMLGALQKYVDTVFTPVYGFGCQLELSPDNTIPAGNWGLALVDHSAEADALGYHEVTPDGKPQIVVAVLDTLGDAGTIEDCVSHEILEALVDPGTNIAIGTNAAQTKFVAAEVCDPVQGASVEIDGWQFAAFVHPAWFQWWNKPAAGALFDSANACRKPLEVLKAGYVSRFAKGKWSEKFGSKRASRRFALRHHARAARRRGKKRLKRKG